MYTLWLVYYLYPSVILQSTRSYQHRHRHVAARRPFLSMFGCGMNEMAIVEWGRLLQHARHWNATDKRDTQAGVVAGTRYSINLVRCDDIYPSC